jgi:hypothetical protein
MFSFQNVSHNLLYKCEVAKLEKLSEKDKERLTDRGRDRDKKL